MRNMYNYANDNAISCTANTADELKYIRDHQRLVLSQEISAPGWDKSHEQIKTISCYITKFFYMFFHISPI